ncbi:MAG: hypothetical protein KBS35_02085, partial [Mycoplasma sp.]|nr:hypothetical protein [Candidatus Hennigella equi]
MKKNRKLVASSIAGLSTFSIVAPIALIASSCSCSCSNGGESVLNGVYTPSFNTFTNDPLAAPKINVTTGENEYLKAASQNKKMPYEEYKWMWSCIAEYMKYGLGMIPEQGLPDGMVKIENLNVKLSNFKFTNVKENRASYSVAGLIDISLDVDSSKFEEWPEEYKWMKTLTGHVKLGWDHKVTNMPLGVFDIGTSNIKNAFNATLGNRFGEQGLEDLPWFDKTLWFIAPDMSQVAFNDPSWRLDYNFMVDADVELNDTKIVNGANNYNFKFDKTMAGTIEAIVESMSQSKRSELIAYVIERFIPLAAGWMSYYLCNTQHYDHIVGIGDGLGWQTYHESNIAYTRLMQPALYKYELADPLDKSVPVDDQMMTFVVGLKAGDILENLMKKQIPFTVVSSVDCKAKVVKDEKGTYFLNTTYDWANGMQYNRPEYGHTTADEPNGPAALIPIVMTKKWVSFGEPFILAEGKNFWDSYPAHNGQEGDNTLQTIDAMGADQGLTTLTFGVSKVVYDDIKSSNKPDDYKIVVKPEGEVAGQALASMIGEWKPREVEDQYYIDVPVGVEAWDSSAEAGATSAPFYISLTVAKEGYTSTLKSGLFQLVKGNPI